MMTDRLNSVVVVVVMMVCWVSSPAPQALDLGIMVGAGCTMYWGSFDNCSCGDLCVDSAASWGGWVIGR